MSSSCEGGAPEVLQIDPGNPSRAAVRRAAEVLRSGGVAVFPTDTLYGLGCSAHSGRGLERLRRLKGEARTSPFILLLADAAWVGSIAASVPHAAKSLMERYWPGPLTIVLAAAGGLAPELVSEEGTVALRLPRSAWCTRLCFELGCPVASTSANRAGRVPARSASEAIDQFGSGLDLVVDGGPPLGDLPSTVVDARGETPLVLREGAVELGDG